MSTPAISSCDTPAGSDVVVSRIICQYRQLFQNHAGLSSDRNVMFQKLLDDLTTLKTSCKTDALLFTTLKNISHELKMLFPEWQWCGSNGGFHGEEPSSRAVFQRLCALAPQHRTDGCSRLFGYAPVVLNVSAYPASLLSDTEMEMLAAMKDMTVADVAAAIRQGELVRHDCDLVGVVAPSVTNAETVSPKYTSRIVNMPMELISCYDIVRPSVRAREHIRILHLDKLLNVLPQSYRDDADAALRIQTILDFVDKTTIEIVK